MILAREAWHACVSAASRAPSPHNAQPARWGLRAAQVQLFGDPAGWLASGDPTGRDDLVALGMAWEAMRLALSQHGFELTRPVIAPGANDRSGGRVRLIAHGELLPNAKEDPLASLQDKRRTWRGRFAAPTREQEATADHCIRSFVDVAVPTGELLRGKIARWYDASAAEGLRNREMARELYRFMRFSPRHPRWTRDGLSADCMAMGGFEAWGASWVMRPGVLALLGHLGLLGAVVSEKPKVESATRIVVLHYDESPFEAGRRWYRFWLALSAVGFAGVPMSALADSPRYSTELLATNVLPAGRRLLNIMRIGPAPAAVPRSARLPVEELLVTTA